MTQYTQEQLEERGVFIISGSATTRALVRSKYEGDKQPIGTLFLDKSGGGHNFIKFGSVNADSDWSKITATNAD